MAQRVTADNFDGLVLHSAKPVLVDFYSDSCAPCKMMAGIVGEIEEENEETASVYKVNVNYEEELAGRYGITAAPTFLAFYEGKETGRLQGVVSKEALSRLLAAGNGVDERRG